MHLGVSKDTHEYFSMELPKSESKSLILEVVRDACFIVDTKHTKPGQLVIIQVHDVWDCTFLTNI